MSKLVKSPNEITASFLGFNFGAVFSTVFEVYTLPKSD